MRRAPYPTDLTDAEWAIVQPLIPPAKPGGRPREVDMRETVDAVFYVIGRGCGWRLLPHDLPPWQTVYTYFRAWQQDGSLAAMKRALKAVGYDDRVRAETPEPATVGSSSGQPTPKDPQRLPQSHPRTH